MTRSAHMPDLERDLVAAAERLRHKSARHGTRARRRRVGPRAAVLAIAAAATAAVIGFALGAGSDPHATAAKARSAAERLGEHFAVFREAPSGENAAGNPFRETGPGLGVSAAEARHLKIADRDIWVAAGDAQVCLMASRAIGAGGFGGACVRPAQAEDNGIFTWGHPAPADVDALHLQPDTSEVAALVMDGVRSVTFTLADGSTRVVGVTGNTLLATFPTSPRSARFRDGNGASHDVPL